MSDNQPKTNNSPFFFVKKNDAKNLKTVTLYGIPFQVLPEGNTYKNLSPAVHIVGKPADKLFFLGMTTERPECSEWWGSAERLYDNTKRLFIGDKVGQINIVFNAPNGGGALNACMTTPNVFLLAIKSGKST